MVEFPNIRLCHALSTRDRGKRFPKGIKSYDHKAQKEDLHRCWNHHHDHCATSSMPWKRHDEISVTRRRDLRSSVARLASLLGDDPGRIPLDLPAISAKLATVSPVAAGLTSKTFSNIRSDFVAAVKVSGLKPIQRPARTPLSPAWKKLFADLSGRRAHIGLSRLARYASANGIEPEQINDATIEAFITAVRDGSLHRKPNGLHRRVTLIWNEVAQRSEFSLQTVEVPSFRRPAKRIEWTSLPSTFRKDVDKYLTLVRRIRCVRGRCPFARAGAADHHVAPESDSRRRHRTRGERGQADCDQVSRRPCLARKLQTHPAAAPRN